MNHCMTNKTRSEWQWQQRWQIAVKIGRRTSLWIFLFHLSQQSLANMDLISLIRFFFSVPSKGSMIKVINKSRWKSTKTLMKTETKNSMKSKPVSVFFRRVFITFTRKTLNLNWIYIVTLKLSLEKIWINFQAVIFPVVHLNYRASLFSTIKPVTCSVICHFFYLLAVLFACFQLSYLKFYIVLGLFSICHSSWLALKENWQCIGVGNTFQFERRDSKWNSAMKANAKILSKRIFYTIEPLIIFCSMCTSRF